jgi:hypothetical protein
MGNLLLPHFGCTPREWLKIVSTLAEEGCICTSFSASMLTFNSLYCACNSLSHSKAFLISLVSASEVSW